VDTRWSQTLANEIWGISLLSGNLHEKFSSVFHVTFILVKRPFRNKVTLWSSSMTRLVFLWWNFWAETTHFDLTFEVLYFRSYIRSCGQPVENWVIDDDPRSARWHLSNCEFIRGSATRNIPMSKCRDDNQRCCFQMDFHGITFILRHQPQRPTSLQAMWWLWCINAGWKNMKSCLIAALLAGSRSRFSQKIKFIDTS